VRCEAHAFSWQPQETSGENVACGGCGLAAVGGRKLRRLNMHGGGTALRAKRAL